MFVLNHLKYNYLTYDTLPFEPSYSRHFTSHFQINYKYIIRETAINR